MRSDVIAKKYAKSVYDTYSGKVEDFLEVLNIINTAKNNKDYQDAINNPFIKSGDKAEFILALLATNKKSEDKKISNFIKLVSKNNKLSLLPSIYTYLNLAYVSDIAKYEGKVFASEKMDKKEIDNLSKLLSKKISKNLVLEYEDDINFNGIKVDIEQLGLELVFSKNAIKNKLSNHILKAI